MARIRRRLNHAREVAPQARQQQNPAPRPPDFNEAIRFVLSVKQEFINDPENYRVFLAVLRGAKSLGAPAVVNRMKILFAAYPNLLRAFNRFLPRGFVGQQPGN